MSVNKLLLLTADLRSLDPILQEQVYNQFYQTVYPMIVYIVKDHSATEDIIQEAFLNIYRRSPHQIEENKLGAWVRAVARNAAISYLRKNNKKRNELFHDDVFIENACAADRYVPSTEAEVEARFMEEAIVQYIYQLKPEYRQVIQMRWIDRLSYKDMACTLSVTENKIRQMLHRAREAVKRKLKRDWSVEDE